MKQIPTMTGNFKSNKVFQKLFKSNFVSFALKAIKITTSCKCGGKLLDAWTPA